MTRSVLRTLFVLSKETYVKMTGLLQSRTGKDQNDSTNDDATVAIILDSHSTNYYTILGSQNTNHYTVL